MLKKSALFALIAAGLLPTASNAQTPVQSDDGTPVARLTAPASNAQASSKSSKGKADAEQKKQQAKKSPLMTLKETFTDTDARKSLNVTVYNEDLALVSDTRNVSFFRGQNNVVFKNVSRQIRPETAVLKGSDIRVMEQNFNFDLLSRETLLQKYLDKTIQVVSTNPATGAETTEDATVLSSDFGLILKIGDRIETDYKGRLIFPDIPTNLRDKPTLVLNVFSQDQAEKNVTLDYLTSGLSWQANYVAELNDAEDSLNLNGWVTLTNTSGVDYDDADINFVAGKLNIVRPVARPRMMYAAKAAMMDAAVKNEAGMAEEALMDYHLYSLGRKTSILSNQTKQLALLSTPPVKAAKEYRCENLVPQYAQTRNMPEFESQSAKVYLTFKNDADSGLGKPLPAGTIRVYKKDKKGHSLFVGEDSIRHTPRNEDIRLALGEAFDVTVSGKQTKRYDITDKIFEITYEMTFKNGKDSPVTVQYYQNAPASWTVLTSTIEYSKPDANRLLWKVPVAGGGKTTLVYSVRVKLQ